jgi:hypothetical protein
MLRLALTGRRIMRHPRLFDYMDEALAPVDETPSFRRTSLDQPEAILADAIPADVIPADHREALTIS